MVFVRAPSKSVAALLDIQQVMSPMEDFAREYPEDENIVLPTVDAPGRERAGESKEFLE